jgi:hypothetical protein
MTLAYSPRYRRPVVLGPGQERYLAELRALDEKRAHRSRLWWDLPPLRSFDRAASTVHQYVKRLGSLGVIAVQTVALGCEGGLRITFGVRPLRYGELRPGMLRRFHVQHAGQLSFMPPDEPEDDSPPMPAPSGLPSTVPAPLPNPFSVPERVPTPQASTTRLPEPPGYVAPRKSFDELMRENGFDKIVFSRPWTRGGR